MRLHVSIDGPSGRRDLSIPDDAPLGELMPAIVKACEGVLEADGWRIAPQGERPMPPEQTLAEAGLFSGAVLVLSAPEPAAPVQAPPRPPRLESMGDRDYVRTLDAAIVARRAPLSTVIAVAGARPGAGATTVTALLTLALSALRDESVVAVDGNPGSGALSHWLVPDSALPADLYSSLFSPDVAPAIVSRTLVGAASRLSVLPAPLDPATARAGDDAAWARLIEHLRRLHHTVVVDWGTRRTGSWADAVVLVNGHGESAGAPAAVTVLNQAPRRIRIQGREITLAAEPLAAARLKRRGFTWADAPPAWQEAVRELAAVLLAGGA